jgi:Leucine-rich repeat (LRR) protein
MMTRRTIPFGAGGSVRSMRRNLFRHTCVVAVAGSLVAGCGGESSTGTSATAPADAGPPVSVAPALQASDTMTVPELHAKLKERNPNYGRNAKIEAIDGQIVSVSLRDCQVSDLGALAGLPLRDLDLFGLPVADIRPLQNMPLDKLFLDSTPVSDISVLAGMPIHTLWLNDTNVTDFSPLAGKEIEFLNLNGTKVETIEFIKGMPLNTLWLPSTKVSDLGPLEGIRLVSLDVENTPVKDLSVVGRIPTLQRLNIAGSQVTDLSPLKELRLVRLIFTHSRIETGLDDIRNMTSIREIGPSFDQRQQPEMYWASHGED